MQLSAPLISVVVPVYNAEQYLKRCLDSIANQTYSNLEIICVNDGSSDKSGDILNEYASKDSRFKIIHQQNTGQATARNVALDNATGDLIASVDSDDYLELYAYEKAIAHFDDDVDMVWFGNHVVGNLDEEHMNAQRDFYELKEDGKMSLESIPLDARSGAVWNKIFRRDIIEKYHIRYPKGVIFEDLCLCANLYPVLRNVYFLPDKLYFYWQREDSTMGVARSKMSEKSKDLLKIITPLYDFYAANGFIKTHREMYVSFFCKFYSLAHKFLPKELRPELLAEAYDLANKYGNNDSELKEELLNRMMEAVFGPKRIRKVRFIGIPIYSTKKYWNHIARKILGIPIYEHRVTPTYTYKTTIFFKDTPTYTSLRFFGIPIYTKMKDATKSRKFLGITIRKKKVTQQPVITANISYLSPNRRLEGKKIVVTGGNRGLGLSMAERFISEGADVLITGRNAAQIEEVACKLGCKHLALDVQEVNSFADFFAKADELLGGINCLVNNAGVSLHEQNIRTVTPEGFDTQINTNLRGSYFLSQHFIKLAESANRKDCSILFISSERGLFVDDIPYGLTKAAINSLVQGLAVRVLPSGIRVNAIAPGITASDMTGYSTDGNLFCNYNASKRVFLPEEVSETACFLLSDCSRCVTGQIIACDQGRAINPHWRRN